MKIILSRKGFDSSYGGCPSPVLPDGTMISMPIPSSDDSGLSFRDIKFGKDTYLDIWDKLYPKHKNDSLYCHLDPDIRADIRAKPVKKWVSAFGQTGTAQRHLHKKDVAIGDLFLFFGWFRETDDSYHYLSDSGKHMIYGYLQIGNIIQGGDIKNNYKWHPHAKGNYGNSNTLYIASKKLTINGQDTNLPGSGVLKYKENLVLTKDNCSRSKWKIKSEWNIESFFENNTISYHSKNSIKDGYFQSACRGQEFVISETEKVTNWAKDLILNNDMN